MPVAAFAGDQDVDQLLDRLLLDGHNTAVTRATAEALLERRDRVGLRPFARAFALADAHQGDTLTDSILTAMQSEAERTALLGRLSALGAEGDATVRSGAGEVRAWIEGA